MFIQGPQTASPDWYNQQYLSLYNKIKNISEVDGAYANANCTSDGVGCLFGMLNLSESVADDDKKSQAVIDKVNGLIEQNPDINGSASLLNLNDGLNVNDNMGGSLSTALMGVVSYDQLEAAANKLKIAMNDMPEVVPEKISFDRLPVYNLSVDRVLASKLSVPIDQLFATLSAAYGGQQLNNDYQFDADSYPIIVQLPLADLKDFSSLDNIYVQANDSAKSMLPVADFVSVKIGSTRPQRAHVNQMRAISFNRKVAPGYTLGQAVAAVEQASANLLPSGVELQFRGAADKLKKGNSELVLIFVMGIIFIYLVLAALFESFIDPFIILLTVPLCIIGALLTLFLIGGSVNLFTGIGLLTLIGLVSKHGVLITQFANERVQAGLSKADAVVEAAVIRLRPISYD